MAARIGARRGIGSTNVVICFVSLSRTVILLSVCFLLLFIEVYQSHFKIATGYQLSFFVFVLLSGSWMSSLQVVFFYFTVWWKSPGHTKWSVYLSWKLAPFVWTSQTNQYVCFHILFLIFILLCSCSLLSSVFLRLTLDFLYVFNLIF